MTDLALDEGAKKNDGVGDPHHRDQHVDRPLELGVLLGGGDAQGQRNGRGDDHRLPTPEGKRGQAIAEKPYVTGALDDIIRGRKECGPTEGEYNRVGVQRPHTTEREPRNIEIERRPCHLRGDQHAHQHTDDAPDHGHHRELAHDLVVIGIPRRHSPLSHSPT